MQYHAGMTTSTTKKPIKVKPEHAIRRQNLLRLIDRFDSRKAFCEAAGTSYAHLSSMLSDSASPNVRPPGYSVMRKIEETLGLPPHCLDSASFGLELMEAVDTQEGSSELPRVASTLSLKGLTALQVAAAEAVVNAMRSGRCSPTNCVEILQRWTVAPPRSILD